ncbi:MAG TPA: phospholipase D-like domain-containing protein [Polyangiaceae bacterium]|nr:phospholipase D-like domain-containing protein [Polyangiaceae bacterium]
MSPVRRAFAILLVAAGIIVVLLMLAQDQETLKVRSAVGVEEPRHPAYIAGLVGSALTRGNRYDVLTNGDQIFPAMLEAVRNAKRRISFETYIYDDGEVANQFTAALEEAARRGVRVNLVVDSVGASGMKGEHIKRLEDAGCRIGKFHSIKWYNLEEVNYRTHRKILVVDGEIGFTGGAGVADHWLGHAQDKLHWRDTQVRMRGPIVRLVEAGFYENFIETAGEVTPELDDPPRDMDDTGHSLVLRSSPTGGANDLKRLYLLAIASARRTIDITTPYFVTDESSEWSLRDAVSRGVKIRILVEGDETDAMPVKYASRNAYERLLSMGIEMYEYRPTMMHTKALVVDGVWSMFGSANFDNRSLELNDELNVAVTDRDLARRFLEDFEQDLRVSSRLELARWRERSLLEKSREKFWSYFGEIF